LPFGSLVIANVVDYGTIPAGHGDCAAALQLVGINPG
jgi:hypothetical protein